jgi:hypothetical protein
MFKAWIFDESGQGNTKDLAAAIDRRAASLNPAHSWLTVPQASKPPVHVECCSSPSSASGVTSSHAAVLMATRKPGAKEFSDETWWNQFGVVIPVIEKAAVATNVLPQCLQHINAFVKARFLSNWHEVLADDLFSQAVLARPAKSVFISYRRCESLGVARQLAEALTGEGFEVFLDERSIPRGKRFDREIRYRLSDVDMVVVLATHGFSQSTWVLDELSLASSSNIGTLVLVWPDAASTSAVLPGLMSDQLLRLTSVSTAPKNGGAEQTLTEGELQSVIGRIYEHRVAAIARRVDNILPAAREAAAQGTQPTLEVGDRLGEIVEPAAGAGNPERITLALPFRPTPLAVWEERSRRASAKSVRCLYQEVLPDDERVRSLDWSLFPHRPTVEVNRV